MRKRARRWGVCVLVLMPVAVRADLNSEAVVSAGSGINLDAGIPVSSGADLSFNGHN